jgi:hypothetical protein
MESNEPYQRVAPDSVVDGLAIGAATGAATAAFTHAGVSMGAKRNLRNYREQSSQLRGNFQDTVSQVNQNHFDQTMKIASVHNAVNVRDGAQSRLRDEYRDSKSVQSKGKYFGSGWRKGLSYGASALIGGAVGTAVDASIDTNS